MNLDNLLSRKGFCVLPFLHSCIFQNGQVQPCCLNNLKLGNVKTQSIEEIYSNNNKNLIDFRKATLGDILPVSCGKCGDIEKHNGLSYRHSSNSNYGYLLNNIDISSEEALVNNEKIFLWDIRLSNLCNLKCLICQPFDSSRIAIEENKGSLVSAFRNFDEFLVAFKKQINNLIEINFAGGEPLLIQNHYKILDFLIRHEKFETVLRYNTNGTNLSLRDKNITEYWKHFKNVMVNVSLDAGWKQFEYLRFGSNWKTTLQNLRTIRRSVPHVEINLNIVIMAFNVLYIRQLYEFLISEQILNGGLIFIPVHGKDYYEVTVLPARLKEQVLKHYQEWEDSLGDSHDSNSTVRRSIQLVKNILINDHDTSYKLPLLKKHTLMKDRMHNTDFYFTFPELKDIFKDVR